jgi:hypothetical protein
MSKEILNEKNITTLWYYLSNHISDQFGCKLTQERFTIQQEYCRMAAKITNRR